MIYKSITIAIIAACSLLACGGGGSATPTVPMPPAVVSGLFVFAGSHDTAGAQDGNALEARFQSPGGIKSDASGNIYLTDNNAIRKISPKGVVSTVAGVAGQAGSTDGVGAAARFSSPSDIAIDATGNLYIVDSTDHTIRKISPAGVVTTPYGKTGQSGSSDGRGSDARFNTPTSITADPIGNLYVVDSSNHTIRKISPDGMVSTFAGSAGMHGSLDGDGASACFNYPAVIGSDIAGNLYVSDSTNRTIRKITPSGVVSTFAGDPKAYPVFVSTDGCSNANQRAHEYGEHEPSADGIGKAARFGSPSGIAVDLAGNVFVVDASAFTIRKISPAGVVTTVAGVALRSGYALGNLPGLLDLPGSLAVIGTNTLITNSGYSLLKIVLP